MASDYKRITLRDLYSEEAIAQMKEDFSTMSEEEKTRHALTIRLLIGNRIKSCFPDISGISLRSRAERIMLREFGICCPKMYRCS